LKLAMATAQSIDTLGTDAVAFDLSPMDAVMRPFGGLAILYIYDAPSPVSGAAFDLDRLERAFIDTVERDYGCVLVGELRWDPSRRGVVYIKQDGKGTPPRGAAPFIKEPQCALSTAEALESLSYKLFMPLLAEGQLIAVKCSLLADGGLAIGVNVSHCLFDGESIFTFMKVWGQHYRGVRDGSTKEKPIQVNHDRHLLAPRGVGPKLEHLEFLVPTLKPIDDASAESVPATLEESLDTDKPVQASPPATGKHVFHITPAMMVKIKATVGGPLDAQDYSYVSTIDSLTALFLVLITRARSHGKDVKFTTGVNARKRFTNPPLPVNYVGNVIFNAFSEYSADELAASDPEKLEEISEAMLRTIARRVRASINQRDDAYLRDAIEFIGAQEDMGAVQVGTNFFFGSDLMFTSWVHMGMYDADFGGGKASYACVPELSCCDGMLVFIEAMHHRDGLDVVVLLETTALGRLEQEWSRLALWEDK
jgi:hypothetical protein